MNLQEITTALEGLSNWGLEGSNALTKQFDFKDFKEALEFVNKISEIAEKSKHFPNITIRQHIVILSLTTHETGEITGKDINLAKEIDSLTSPLNKI